MKITTKKRLTSGQLKDLHTALSKLPNPPSMLNKVIDGKPTVVMNLSEDMLLSALHLSEAISIVAKAKGLTEWIESTPEQRKAGMMGQLTVALWLYGDWTKAFKYVTIGEGDNGDIQIGNFIINVITNSRMFTEPYENLAVIDCERFRRKPYPIYIACSRLDDNIIIWGWAKWDEVPHWDKSALDEYPPSWHTPHKNLHNLDELKETFKFQIER